MLHEDLTINDFENELKNIIENNLLTQVDNCNIARLREEFRKVISKAKHFNIIVILTPSNFIICNSIKFTLIKLTSEIRHQKFSTHQ